MSSPGTPQKTAFDATPIPPTPPSVASWAIVASAAVIALNILGVNVLPLLTVGGASTIIVGFASQQLLANAVNGISIVSHGGSFFCLAGGNGVQRVTPQQLLANAVNGISIVSLG